VVVGRPWCRFSWAANYPISDHFIRILATCIQLDWVTFVIFANFRSQGGLLLPAYIEEVAVVASSNPIHRLKPRPYRLHWYIGFGFTQYIRWLNNHSKKIEWLLGWPAGGGNQELKHWYIYFYPLGDHPLYPPPSEIFRGSSPVSCDVWAGLVGILAITLIISKSNDCKQHYYWSSLFIAVYHINASDTPPSSLSKYVHSCRLHPCFWSSR